MQKAIVVTIFFVCLITGIVGVAIQEARGSLDRKCKVCEESCCPKRNNCSCLHTDACNCVEPTHK